MCYAISLLCLLLHVHCFSAYYTRLNSALTNRNTIVESGLLAPGTTSYDIALRKVHMPAYAKKSSSPCPKTGTGSISANHLPNDNVPQVRNHGESGSEGEEDAPKQLPGPSGLENKLPDKAL